MLEAGIQNNADQLITVDESKQAKCHFDSFCIRIYLISILDGPHTTFVIPSCSSFRIRAGPESSGYEWNNHFNHICTTIVWLRKITRNSFRFCVCVFFFSSYTLCMSFFLLWVTQPKGAAGQMNQNTDTKLNCNSKMTTVKKGTSKKLHNELNGVRNETAEKGTYLKNAMEIVKDLNENPSNIQQQYEKVDSFVHVSLLQNK